MMKALRDAYEGFYEKELANVPQDKLELEIASLIYAHSPKERLAVYLEWYGILGFTETIYAIATGEL